MSALLVVIEGIDFSGKTTQVTRLVRELELRGESVERYHFPSDTMLGKFTRQLLSGIHSVPDDSLLALFTANRLESRIAIQDALQGRKTVVCDRYSSSEYAYGIAKELPIAWLEALESRMPLADITFLLDLDPSQAAQRHRLNAKRDRFEADYELMERVRREYLRIAKSGHPASKEWVILDATEDEKLLASEILETVISRLLL